MSEPVGIPIFQGRRDMKTLAEISSLISRGTAPSYVEASSVLAIGQRCVQDSGLDASAARPHDPALVRNVLRPRSGDVLLNSTGTGTIGRSCVFDLAGESFIVDSHVTVIRPRPDLADGRWIQMLISSAAGQRYLEKHCYTGSTNQVELVKGRLAEMVVPVPPVAEQRRIAEIFGVAHEQMMQTARVIGKLDSVNAGLAHDALYVRNGGSRWPLQAIDACIERIDAGASPDLEDVPAGFDEWGVLKVSAIKPSRFVAEENKVLSISSLVDPDLEVRHGDLLISRANTFDLVGIACVARNPRPRLLLCDKTLRLVPRADVALPDFIELALAQHEVRVQIEASATGTSGSMKNISQEAIRRLVIPVPPLQQQKDIVKAATIHAKRIQAERMTLKKLMAVKSGLMEDLLTGKVRVTCSEGPTG
jgi:type I restriction enzyme S subunit